MKKLRQNKGETLVETMLSLMIAVLSIGLIATAVMAATNINRKVGEMDEAYKQQLQAAECYETMPRTQPLRITFRDKNGMSLIDTRTTTVEVYGEDDSAFISYCYEPEVESP